MERGEESNANNNNNNNNNGEEGGGIMKRKEEEFSAMTKETVSKIKRLKSKKEPMCTIHDNTSPGYGWLLPGWVAQERHMDSGRVYRYYYDPEGNRYSSRSEVIAAWDKSGMIVIDD